LPNLLRFLALAVFVTLSVVLSLVRNADAGALVTPNPAFGANSASASSWLAGAHEGYNWQSGAVVYGFETDLQATHLDSSMTGGLSYKSLFPPPRPSDFAMTSSSIDWYGTLRGRLGLTTGPFLLYGTGGLAYGNVELNSAFSTLGFTTSAQTSDLRLGWVAGAGIDYSFNSNLIFNVLYEHVDLGSVSVSSAADLFAIIPFGRVTIGQEATAHARFDAVMAGFSWRFAPEPAGAWAGAYVGGQGGNAWGNSTSAAYTSTEPVVLLSDARLKRDISLVGTRSDGLGVYRFKYLWSDHVYVGVIAQEVALIHPAAVIRDRLTGLLSVDYGRLGMPFIMLR